MTGGHEIINSMGGHSSSLGIGSGIGGNDDITIGPKVVLEDLELWEKFHGLTNEMIVTKSGR